MTQVWPNVPLSFVPLGLNFLVFLLCGLANPLGELGIAFFRSFHVESQTVRLIPMLACPAAPPPDWARMKYDNVTRIFTSISPRSSNTCVGPWQPVKVHVFGLDVGVDFLVGLQRFLDYEGGCVRQTAKSAFDVGDTVSIAS